MTLPLSPKSYILDKNLETQPDTFMIDQQALSIIGSIIKKRIDPSKYKIFIFGSRTRPHHRKFCDVDIGIMGSENLPLSTLLQIKEDLSSSDIPYLTDVVDFGTVSEDFKKEALTNIITI
ncbi:MAG: nucleotidyltransferase domain-containing protein [Patescibacteria group bacterium]|nr:nucleotidyltransferase domain-containing protein [Patescibacteria group bacterium]